MSDDLTFSHEHSSAENDFRMLSPVTLAFLGDAVFELAVRERLIRRGGTDANKLHKKTITFVNAGAQAKAVEKIKPFLTKEEQNVLRRGRNANTSHVPKNADLLDYRHATGFEAVLGYLYLRGENARILQILDLIMGETDSKQVIPVKGGNNNGNSDGNSDGNGQGNGNGDGNGDGDGNGKEVIICGTAFSKE